MKKFLLVIVAFLMCVVALEAAPRYNPSYRGGYRYPSYPRYNYNYRGGYYYAPRIIVYPNYYPPAYGYGYGYPLQPYQNYYSVPYFR